MLEVCFCDSVRGSLMHAQNCNNCIGGAVSFITGSKGIFSYFEKRRALKEYKKRKLVLQKQAVSLGGRREDIVSISFGLSEGDIKAPITIDSCPRKDYISSIFAFDRHDEHENMEQTISSVWNNCIEDLEKLKSSPEKVRIWLDRTPDAQCGLLFVADLLKNSEREIHIIELPERIRREDHCIVEYRGWGDVEPELFGTFLDGERILTKAEIMKLSQQWEKLKEENAPLRVVENGAVISTDESYYDNLIRCEFPKDTCKVAHIIGNTLGKHMVLTGDVFIAKRIQHFIHAGELVVMDNSDDRFYGTVVSRC